MSYLAYTMHLARTHGIGTALRFVGKMERFGITELGWLATGGLLTLVGLFVGRWVGFDLGYLMAMAGAVIVGNTMGTGCVLHDSCPCDDPEYFDKGFEMVPEKV